MSKTFRNIISTIIIIATVLAIHLGALSAFKKANLYIHAVRAPYSGESITVNEATDNFEDLFNSASPVGEDEMVRRSLASIVDLVKNSDLEEEQISHFAEFAEEDAVFGEKVLQYIYTAQLYDALYNETKDIEDLNKSVEYLIKVREIGPKLPQPLEALAILYTRTGEVDKLQEITNKILELWPDHPSIQTQELIK